MVALYQLIETLARYPGNNKCFIFKQTKMHQLELLVQQLQSHLTFEFERIERLKDFSDALVINGTFSSLQVSQIEYPGYSQCNGTKDAVDSSKNHVQESVTHEVHFQKPPLQQNRNLWSSLGQYQIKRDKLTQERKREYQEYLKHQNTNGHHKEINCSDRELIVRTCKDRNELDKERRKREEEKYRGELRKQIEENRIRKEIEKEKELQVQQQDELRLKREREKLIAREQTRKEPIKVAEDNPLPTKRDDRIRSPSYLHIKERVTKNDRIGSTSIKLRPLLEAFARSKGDFSTSDARIGDVMKDDIPKGKAMASLSQVRNKMIQDHQELMNKLQVS